MPEPGLALTDVETSLRAILDHANDVIVVLDPDGTIRFVSPRETEERRLRLA